MNRIVTAVGTVDAQSWIKSNVVPLVLIIVAVTILMLSRKKNFRDVFAIVAIVIVGLAVLSLATGNNASDIGTWALGLFTT